MSERVSCEVMVTTVTWFPIWNVQQQRLAPSPTYPIDSNPTSNGVKKIQARRSPEIP